MGHVNNGRDEPWVYVVTRGRCVNGRAMIAHKLTHAGFRPPAPRQSKSDERNPDDGRDGDARRPVRQEEKSAPLARRLIRLPQ